MTAPTTVRERGSARPDTWMDRNRGRLFLLLLAILLLFAISDYQGARWIARIEGIYPHLSQIIQGGLSTLICLLLLISVIGRESPLPLSAQSSTDDWLCGTWPKSQEPARKFARWFIAVRWVAIAVAATLATIAIYFAHLLSRQAAEPLAWTLGGLALSNVIYRLLLLRRGDSPQFLPAQVYTDLGFFALLLHFAGGIENPLSLLMVLHVIIAGAALRRRQCYFVAAVASMLLAFVGWAEWQGIVAHYPLLIFPGSVDLSRGVAHSGASVLALIALHGVIFFITASFVSALAERVRKDEQQLMAIASEAIQARQMAEKAVRSEKLAAVGALAGQVAHEVNNPIAVISAKGRLLLQDHSGEISAAVAQELRKIVEQADRVAQIAQGLLSSCRPSPGRRSPIAIQMPVRKALETIERRACASDVQVEDRLPESLPPIVANDGEMQQVFLNLFLNALDAMPQGGTLRVDGRQIDGRAELVINDTGAGIPSTVRERLFEPFVTTKEQGRGTGLGLSICRGLVRSHGGEIQVESEIGRGTRFTVTLPLATSSNSPAKENAHG